MFTTFVANHSRTCGPTLLKHHYEFGDPTDRRLAKKINFTSPRVVTSSNELFVNLSTPEESRIRQAIVEPMRCPLLFEIPSRYFLLHGSDGCGKSILTRNIFRIFQRCQVNCEDAIHLHVNCERFDQDIKDHWRLTLCYLKLISFHLKQAFIVLECENIHHVIQSQSQEKKIFDEILLNPQIVVIGTTTHVDKCVKHFTAEDMGMIVAISKPTPQLIYDILNISLLKIFDPDGKVQHEERKLNVLNKLDEWCNKMGTKMAQKGISMCELCNVQIPRFINALSKARKNWYDSENKCLHAYAEGIESDSSLIKNLQKKEFLATSDILKLNSTLSKDEFEKAVVCPPELSSQIQMNIKWLTAAWSIFTQIGEEILMDFS